MTHSNIGLSLKPQHFEHWQSDTITDVGWAEIHPENFLDKRSTAYHNLGKVAERWPISFHCVGMNLGGVTALNLDYFARLKSLIAIIDPVLVSDHLSWTALNNRYTNDLLPVPYTPESLTHFAERIDQAQNLLGRQLLIENPSIYVNDLPHVDYSEPQFLNDLAKITGCRLLVDLNNLIVNQTNGSGIDADKWLATINTDLIGEFHLASASLQTLSNGEQLLIDDHSGPVYDQLYALMSRHYSILKDRPILIEWDTDIPAFETLHHEAINVANWQQDRAFSCN